MLNRFPNTRDLRIDFFRGIALVCMFWDHIPGNPLGYLTLRNLGLSDAAELFVFLAGYGAMLAYGRAYLRDGYFPAALKALRRAWTLYVAHVFLLAQLMAVVFVANARVETRDFISEMGLGYFLNEPEAALVGGVLLQFKPVLMDPLPLYVILMAVLAGLLPLLVRYPWWVLVPSCLLWLLEKHVGLNLPAAPEGVWFFNPLAWQFLFFLGACCARPRPLIRLRAMDRRVLDRVLMPLAGSVLLLSFALSMSWRWPALHDQLMPQAMAQWIYPISKTDLDLLRIAHFLTLAYVAARWIRPGAWLNRGLAASLGLMGRYSLEVFCLSVLLAPLADAAGALSGDAPGMQVLAGLLGAALMAALAAWLDLLRRPRTAEGAPAAPTPTSTPPRREDV
jgi:hypothetical protein